ncbi:MAG TPA: type II toxin-antitoxin system RelE/ParE family toxin [Rhizobium sp.]
MGGYLFYPRADVAQDRIWIDTTERWGETQADKYIVGLHAHLLQLSKTKALWRRLPPNLVATASIKTSVFLSRYERHYIFFRELPSGKIGVMSILHERMDMPARLREDLASIIDKLR